MHLHSRRCEYQDADWRVHCSHTISGSAAGILANWVLTAIVGTLMFADLIADPDSTKLIAYITYPLWTPYTLIHVFCSH